MSIQRKKKSVRKEGEKMRTEKEAEGRHTGLRRVWQEKGWMRKCGGEVDKLRMGVG